MKRLLFIFNILLTLGLASFTACHQGEQEQDQGRVYQVKGTIVADSTVVLDSLMLYADNHSSLRVDTIELDQEHQFTSQFRTAGFDELYLCSDGGELCRFYATEGMDVEFTLSMGENGLDATFVQTETDTINAWIQAMNKMLIGQSENRKHEIMDSITAQKDTSLRTTLLIRNHVIEIQDSLYVRQLLGGLPASAKPEWLMKSIDHLLNEKSSMKERNRRLQTASFDIKDDSVMLNMSDPRSDYLLIYFWADYSMPSLDSLKTMANLVKDTYAEKRLRLMTCCLHASDSTWWTLRTLNMAGKHTWVKGGFGDPRISDWEVHSVPSVILLDMYNNLLQRDVWGDQLRKALERVPKKAPSI